MNSADHSKSQFTLIFLSALLLSLFTHFVFLLWSKHFTIQQFGEAYYEKLVPKSFHLHRADIDPALLAETTEPPSQQELKPTALSIPHDQFTIESETLNSTAPQNPPTLSADTLPLSEPSNSTFQQALTETQNLESKMLVNEMEQIREQLLESTNTSSKRPVLPLTPSHESLTSEQRSTAYPAIAEFSDLDQLLAETGPLTKDTKPIFVSSDVLFDYNASQLRSQAIKSLEKLGLLLKRNPEAKFIIEGHTDSFGSDQYNQNLSEQRAESVKQWLIDNASIQPTRIETHGYGKSRLLVPATGNITEQQINRRVEIRIQ